MSRIPRSDTNLLFGRTGDTELLNPIIRSLPTLSGPIAFRPSLDGAEKQRDRNRLLAA